MAIKLGHPAPQFAPPAAPPRPPLSPPRAAPLAGSAPPAQHVAAIQPLHSAQAWGCESSGAGGGLEMSVVGANRPRELALLGANSRSRLAGGKRQPLHLARRTTPDVRTGAQRLPSIQAAVSAQSGLVSSLG